MSVDEAAMWIEANISVPLFSLSGKYYLDATLFSIFPISGKGAVTGDIEDVEIFVRMYMEKVDESVFIKDFQISMKFEHSSLHLENLLGGWKFVDVIQSAINTILPDVYKTVEPLFVSDLNGKIRQKLNDEITGNEAVEAIFLGAFDDEE